MLKRRSTTWKTTPRQRGNRTSPLSPTQAPPLATTVPPRSGSPDAPTPSRPAGRSVATARAGSWPGPTSARAHGGASLASSRPRCARPQPCAEVAAPTRPSAPYGAWRSGWRPAALATSEAPPAKYCPSWGSACATRPPAPRSRCSPPPSRSSASWGPVAGARSCSDRPGTGGASSSPRTRRRAPPPARPWPGGSPSPRDFRTLPLEVPGRPETSTSTGTSRSWTWGLLCRPGTPATPARRPMRRSERLTPRETAGPPSAPTRRPRRSCGPPTPGGDSTGAPNSSGITSSSGSGRRAPTRAPRPSRCTCGPASWGPCSAACGSATCSPPGQIVMLRWSPGSSTSRRGVGSGRTTSAEPGGRLDRGDALGCPRARRRRRVWSGAPTACVPPVA